MKFKLVDVLQLLLVGLSWVLLFLVMIFLVVVEWHELLKRHSP